MANTDTVESARRIIFLGDISENRPNSEAVMQKIAGNINFLLDRQTIVEEFQYNGLFASNGGFDEGAGGIVYISNDVQIDEYYMALQNTGTSGTSTFNAKVYDENGGFINDLFGTGVQALSISGNNGESVITGRANLLTTNDLININTGGHVVQAGTLNLTSLFKGYYIIPYIVGNAPGAFHLTFKIKLKGL